MFTRQTETCNTQAQSSSPPASVSSTTENLPSSKASPSDLLPDLPARGAPFIESDRAVKYVSGSICDFCQGSSIRSDLERKTTSTGRIVHTHVTFWFGRLSLLNFGVFIHLFLNFFSSSRTSDNGLDIIGSFALPFTLTPMLTKGMFGT